MKSLPESNQLEILQAKLFRPRVSEQVISRPHLFKILNAGLKKNLILVTAPPGYGKTTLVSAWLENLSLPSAWFSLDDNDDDHQTFLGYFVAALQTLVPEACSETQKLLHAPESAPVKHLRTRLINELHGIRKELVLVIDDLHLIHSDKIHQTLKELLSYKPEQLHLVLISRDDPPLPLNTWRAKGLLQEVRASDLQFSRSESGVFLQNLLGGSLSEESISMLDEKTEGWVSGLQLAAFSLRYTHDITGFLKEFSKNSVRGIREYLFDQCFNRQPRPLQEFLLKTSILKRFSAPLCHALGISDEKITDIEDTIHVLSRRNLFIIALDDHDEWYRYHNLFAQTLQDRMKTILPAEEIRLLHLKSANWLAARGFINEAVEHALAAAEEDLAAEILEKNIVKSLNNENISQIDHWLSKLSPKTIRNHPRLLVMKSWVRSYQNPYKEKSEYLTQAFYLLENDSQKMDPKTRTFLEGYANALLPFYNIHNGSFQEGVKAGQKGLALDEEHQYARGRASVGWALCKQALGCKKEAEEFLNAELSRQLESNAYSLAVLYALAGVYLMDADFSSLTRTSQRLIDESARYDFHQLRGWGHCFKGCACLYQNELEEAVKQFSAVVDLKYIASHSTIRESLTGLALSYQILRQNEKAEKAVQELVEFEENYIPEKLVSLQARLDLIKNRQPDSASLQVHPELKNIPAGIFIWLEIPQLTLARTLIRRGTSDSLAEAAPILEGLYRHACSTHCTLHSIEILITLAELYERQNRLVESRTCLEKALELAEPGRVFQPFIEFGQEVLPLLEQISAEKPAGDFSRVVLDTLDEKDKTEREPRLLTPRELEILLLLTKRFSNREIAESLFITTDTVKKHCIHIYSKLGVNKRKQAVLRARELGFLDS